MVLITILSLLSGIEESLRTISDSVVAADVHVVFIDGFAVESYVNARVIEGLSCIALRGDAIVSSIPLAVTVVF